MRFQTLPNSNGFVLDERGQAALMAILKDGTGPGDDPKRREDILSALERRGTVRDGVQFQSTGKHALLPELPEPKTWLNGDPDQDSHLTQWWVDRVFEQFSAFRGRLDRLSYLGPMRTAPTRFQTLSSARSASNVTGGYTTRLLAENRAEIRPGNSDATTLQDDVNEWLTMLGIDYELSVDRIGTQAGGLEIGDLVATSLTRNGVVVTPQDVGYGISQLLPIIVQLVAGRQSTICIEQPEVHIHPRLQTELAELFIESTRRDGFGNQVIVETHSEHLLLRFLAKIRDKEFDRANLSVLYVGRDKLDGWADPVQLGIDENGDFIDTWPDGFFDERSREIFSR